MLTRRVRCTKCRFPLPPGAYNTDAFHRCVQCESALQVEIFPALLEPPRIGLGAEAVEMEGDASCFFHPAKRAAVPCDGCGRFLCTLCEIELGGRHFCPQCLESGRKKGSLSQLETRRTLYDSLALTVAVLPLLISPITIITAPIAIYLSIRYWNAPSSVVPRGKWRFIVALLFALGELTVWGMLIVPKFFP